MLPKPDACKGCPFYGNGQGFVPDEDKPNAQVVVLMQNPGAEEEREGKPAIGKTGQLMDAKFLPLAGLDRSQVRVGNAIRCRFQSSNELPPLDLEDCRKAVEHCSRAYLRIPQGARVIAQGAFALYAATGHGVMKYDRIGDWRGWAMPQRLPGSREIPNAIYRPTLAETCVLAAPHLAALFRDPSLQHPAKYDWRKFGMLLSGKWPEPMPRIDFEPPKSWPRLVAFDTEFVPATGQLIRYSIAWREPDGEPRVHVVDGSDPKPIPMDGPLTAIMHSTDADIDYLDQLTRGEYPLSIEDTMHAHAVLWSDLEHSLDFEGSLYARINRWKHLERTSPLIYSGGDALGTWDVWQALAAEFRQDPQSEWIYRNLQLPQVHVIRRATRVGLRTNPAHVKWALDDLEARCDDAEAQAQAALGWPINLGSGPQVTHQLYTIEKVHETARRKGR